MIIIANSILVLLVLAVGSEFPLGKIQDKTASQNYREYVALPRAGETANSSQTELEEIVSAHNQRLTQNPAPKNRNRIVYLNGPNQYKSVTFPVAPNTLVVDGMGKTMAYLPSGNPKVEINFGQHKMIASEDHVMVFAAQTAGSGPVTGWIAASALLPSTERSQFAKELSMNVTGTPALGDAPETYQVLCGAAEDWNAGRLKILPNVDDRRNRHEAASDYVARPGGFCYLLTSLPGHGGVATDTLSNGVTFVPAAGMPHVEVPLYLPADSTSSERDAWVAGNLPHQMEFRYGRVGARYGWIASADLRLANQESNGEGANPTKKH
jgi:hypothetical protein